jgi:hypothetical protein
MSESAASGATRAGTPPPDPRSSSTAELVGSLGGQIGTPVRDEVRLAQAGIPQKAEWPAATAVGKKDVQQATPPLPTETIAGAQDDVAVKDGVAR